MDEYIAADFPKNSASKFFQTEHENLHPKVTTWGNCKSVCHY